MDQNTSQNYPISIVQGGTLIQTVTWYDSNGVIVNLTGYTADMQFRMTVEDTGAPIIELSTANGLITINGTAGTVTFTLPSTTTSPLTDGQQMVYNLFVYSPSNVVTPLLAGPAYVKGSTIR